ncbi:MAG TPA: 3-oxoadipate enol-lactonase [Polyangiaceae bacterium]|nr:3-oxoadipate enol-lactonase [Polyangiaceae bacterium]
MSFIRSGGAVSFYELRQAASAAPAPALLLIHALGTSHRIWDGVLGELRYPGPVLRYDLRGHGLSEIGECPYDIASLAADAGALLDQLGVGSVIVCGLSVGGLIAQEFALAAGSRVRGAILCGTAARIGSVELWQTRIAQVREGGVGSIAEAALGRWFSPGFRAREPDAVRGYRCLLERTPSAGYLAMLHALRDADLGERLPLLRAPTLVVSGELDQATTPDDGRKLAGLIPGARFELLSQASHLLCVEKPRELAALIDGFSQGLGLG